MDEQFITTTKQLGQAVRKRRKESGLTQSQVASLSGVGTRFLSELERGKPTAQIGKTIKILQLLGLELRIAKRN